MNRPLRVLLADDSPTMRLALKRILSGDPRLEVVGDAVDGAEAVKKAVELRPDMVTMDIQMPHLDGLEATRQVMRQAPTRILVVSSYTADAELNLSFNAIQAGALEIFGKPVISSPEELAAWGKGLCEAMVWVGTIPLKVPARPGPAEVGEPLLERESFDILGVAASTGGPPVIAEILGHLRNVPSYPILIAQHMTEGFTQGFRKWLRASCPFEVEMAQEGVLPLPGRVYLPPDGCHLEVDEKGLVRLEIAGPESCPSGDRLLGSLARAYRERSAGLVLTGMGEDGGRGLLTIHQAGGITLAQDEKSCVVYGMPKFAQGLGAVQWQLPPEGITLFLNQMRERAMK